MKSPGRSNAAGLGLLTRRLAATAAAALASGCVPTVTPLPPERDRPTPLPPPAEPARPPDPVEPPPDPPVRAPIPVRVALAVAADSAHFDATGQWEARAAGGDLVLRAGAGERWRGVSSGATVAFTGPVGDVRSGAGSGGSVVIRGSLPETLLLLNGRRYRGQLTVTPTDSGLLIVNTLDVEEYLRGVVPLEIGDRPAAEIAAAEAQAIAARSYTYVRIRSRGRAQYDLRADVLDQVYGGVEAERSVASQAVVVTAGLGIFYAGALVEAPYHSTCGGRTAAVPEVWHRQPDRLYLQAVSDRIPGSNRHWCDSSATFSWTRTMRGPDLNAAIARYLRAYVPAAPVSPGAVRQLSVASRTPSGRVRALSVVTEQGRYVLRGNDIRFVLRTPDGRILNSTSFTVSTTPDRSGRVQTATIRGSGNGHGIGMCQWGAIGRARAGFSARDILAAYYPGTMVGLVNPADLRSAQ